MRPGGLGTMTWGVGNTSDGWIVDKEGWRWLIFSPNEMTQSPKSFKKIINVFDWKGR